MAWQWHVVSFMLGAAFAAQLKNGNFLGAAGFALCFVGWCARCWLDQKEPSE